MSIDALWHLSPIPGGFTMQRPGGPIAHTILWEEVQEIRTYKVDLFAYDEICLAFQTPAGWHEIEESDAGFMEVAKRMEAAFLELPRNWYSAVAVPAFEPCEAVLYRRG